MKVKEFIKPIAVGENSRRYAFDERKDCTVRALANAGELNYVDAYQQMQKAGRIKNKGTGFEVFNPVYENNGFKAIAAFGTTHAGLRFRQLINQEQRYAGMSLKRAVQQFNDGSYIFITAAGRHAVACVDGELIDTFSNKAHESVVLVYKKES